VLKPRSSARKDSVQITKNATVASAITNVASHPIISIERAGVSADP
jgi:hypothetical protein